MISFFVFKCKMRLKILFVSFVKVESSFFLTQVSPKWIYFNNKAGLLESVSALVAIIWFYSGKHDGTVSSYTTRTPP